jgi:hypothetical protein
MINGQRNRNSNNNNNAETCNVSSGNDNSANATQNNVNAERNTEPSSRVDNSSNTMVPPTLEDIKVLLNEVWTQYRKETTDTGVKQVCKHALWFCTINRKHEYCSG